MIGSEAAPSPSPFNIGHIFNKAKDFFSRAGKCMGKKGIPANLQANAEGCQNSVMYGPQAFATCAGMSSIPQAADAISCLQKNR